MVYLFPTIRYMDTTDQVEVKLLQYIFKFKRLKWREEFAIIFPPKVSPQRIVLSHALLDVSGIVPKTPEEAMKVLNAVPIALVERVYRIWKGSFPASRKFTTSRLYKAPEPVVYNQKMVEREGSQLSEEDRAIVSKYGVDQLAESRDIQERIRLAAKKKEGGYLGADTATPEEFSQ